MIYAETEHLILRDWQESDLLPFQQMNANYQVRKYFPSLLSYRRSELDLRTMDNMIKDHGIGLFAVEYKANRQWIGFIGLNYIPDYSDYPFSELPLYEIGWRLLPEYWGQGLATEGAQAVINLAREHHIGDIYSFTAQANQASIRVMEKLGMHYYDHFELPELSKYHPLKRQVRYYLKLTSL
ncbi:GNAT family N-acetyltransferase [Staphylococcus simiae]|uniref:GNAT family N-acetyltransferase n=1 Tax=Staphylococcus simiae TaxID=308354 RepID=UPI001A962EF0|nr:GNAT family N-acetyltransferase [Staphylococcus simiae]MBO1198856.1 GNAT family N-acetyltransferase [Staphylococcus simiae]MBO1201053.1 GNAT family N-acetyltransferase [Staphylococcus simiae]MBO1204026.1 GNAT family N-acetyltransferase [Staphylococcus simiae]MBO1211093.1 GNAT family N-acetyltransferase [Staphylococcus simiae]MBO1229354.1 GNAT family N-acetyltransferase [Staphylococcus simiae]